MAQLTKVQKILGIILIMSIGYLLYDMSSNSDGEKTSNKKKLNPPTISTTTSQVNNKGNRKQFYTRTKQTTSPKKDSTFAQFWGPDPFVRSSFLKDIPSIQESEPIEDLVQLNNYVLSAVSYKGREAFVLINKEVLKLGDKIDGLRVERILPNSVILSKAGKKYIIKLKGV